MDEAVSVAFKDKIVALFEGIPHHVSATVGDLIKVVHALIDGPDPEAVESPVASTEPEPSNVVQLPVTEPVSNEGTPPAPTAETPPPAA